MFQSVKSVKCSGSQSVKFRNQRAKVIAAVSWEKIGKSPVDGSRENATEGINELGYEISSESKLIRWETGRFPTLLLWKSSILCSGASSTDLTVINCSSESGRTNNKIVSFIFITKRGLLDPPLLFLGNIQMKEKSEKEVHDRSCGLMDKAPPKLGIASIYLWKS